MPESNNAGVVLGSEDAGPLEFGIGVNDQQLVQLDDLVVVEADLATVYRATDYWVNGPDGRFSIRIDEVCAQLDELLACKPASSWAYVTEGDNGLSGKKLVVDGYPRWGRSAFAHYFFESS